MESSVVSVAGMPRMFFVEVLWGDFCFQTGIATLAGSEDGYGWPLATPALMVEPRITIAAVVPKVVLDAVARGMIIASRQGWRLWLVS